MADFRDMIYMLERWGVADVILPFILIFAIVFAILENTNILNNKRLNIVVSLVMGLSVVVPHVMGNSIFGFDAVLAINEALPKVSLLLVSIVMMLLTIGLWSGKRADGSKGIGVWFTMASVVVVILIFTGTITSNLPYWLYNLLSSDIVPLVVAILVFGLIVKFIVGSDGNEADKAAANKIKSEARQEALSAFFGGGGGSKEK